MSRTADSLLANSALRESERADRRLAQVPLNACLLPNYRTVFRLPSNKVLGGNDCKSSIFMRAKQSTELAMKRERIHDGNRIAFSAISWPGGKRHILVGGNRMKRNDKGKCSAGNGVVSSCGLTGAGGRQRSARTAHRLGAKGQYA